ncbi:putative homing endonuclease [Vibrio phage vB_VpaM_R16F]|nr:putative homing endonuclease [Vibrio phage vB_VpaM_R16F]
MGKIKYEVGYKFKQPFGNVLTFEKTSDVKGRAFFSCDRCSRDKELFPTGLFESLISVVKRGSSPCLCSKTNRHPPAKNKIILNRLLLNDKSNLRVVEYLNAKKLICECTICSKDQELWPYGSITMTKEQIKMGGNSCGCAFNPKWTTDQYKIRVKRKASELGLIFKGFVGSCSNINKNTKLILNNPVTGSVWDTTSIDKFIRDGSVADPVLMPDILTEESCELNIKNYLGSKLLFIDNYVGGFKGTKSIIEWVCDKGHTNISHYRPLIHGLGCKTCYKHKNRSNGKGFYPNRINEDDTFYALLINDSYVKIGRSFCIKDRLKDIRRSAKTTNIKVLYKFKGKHIDVYNHEQYMLDYLRNLKLSYDSGWSYETFKLNSIEHIVSSTNINNKLVSY